MTIPNITIDYKAETIPDSVWEVIGPEFYRSRRHGFFKSFKKFVTKVVKYVAPIVIPIVAAPIAAAIGASAVIGSTAASALVGAGLGAATSAATGGDPLLGAITGGVGGYMAAPTVGATNYTAGPSVFGGIGESVSNAVGVVRDAAGNLVSSLTGQPVPQTFPQATPAYGASNPIMQADMAAGTYNAPTQSAANVFVPASPGLSTTASSPMSSVGNVDMYGRSRDVVSQGIGIQDPSQIPINQMEAATTSGSFVRPDVTVTTLPPAGESGGPDVFSRFGVTRRPVSTANMPGFPEGFNANTPAEATVAQQQDPGIMQQIKNAFAGVPKAISDKFTDPKQLANSLLQGGVMIAASYLGGMSGTAEENASQQEINDYLQELKARDQEAYASIMEAAKNQLEMAGQFNPQYFAQLRVNLEKQKQGAQNQQLLKQAGLKTGGQQAEARRRLQIQGAQDTGTAYTQGMLGGIDAQNKLVSAGIGSLGKAGLGQNAYLNALTAQNQALTNQAAGIADATTGFQTTLGSLIPTDKDELEKLEEEIKKLKESKAG
tara:strand:+ start:4010 stop:5650 length:1641 start_codon:yes stop_codon:yes gene_type:complete